MSALKCYKFQARTFLEIYNQLWLMGPCFKGYLSYKFDRPEAIRERVKTDEFLPSLGPETLRKLFGALDASEKFSYSSLYHIFKNTFRFPFLRKLTCVSKMWKIVGNFLDNFR